MRQRQRQRRIFDRVPLDALSPGDLILVRGHLAAFREARHAGDGTETVLASSVRTVATTATSVLRLRPDVDPDTVALPRL